MVVLHAEWQVDGAAQSRQNNDDEDWALSARSYMRKIGVVLPGRPCLLQYEYDMHSELATHVVFADHQYQAFPPDQK